MSCWQWLDFVNDQQMLTDFNKRGGVIMAFLGALVATPDGVKHSIAKALRPVRKLRSGFRNFVQRIIAKFQRSPKPDNNKFGHLGLSGETKSDYKPGLVWMEAADIEEKVGWLKDEVVRLEKKGRADVSDLVKRDKRLEADLAVVRKDLTADIAALKWQVDDKESKSAQVDALGLYPITAGIILSGIPEDVASWGIGGWLFWLAGAIVTAIAVILSLRRRHWHQTESS